MSVKIFGKSAQVTVFIVVAIIVVVAFGIFYFTKGNIKSVSQEPSVLSSEGISSTIQNCVDITLLNGLIYIGEHGGYYALPSNSLNDELVQTAYYYVDGRSSVPSVDEMERQAGLYINDNLESCMLEDLSGYENFDFSLAQSVQSEVSIEGDVVKTQVIYPITITQNDGVTNFKDFSSEVKSVRINTIHRAVSEATGDQLASPNLICASCLLEIAENYDLYIDFQYIDSENVVFNVIDYQSNVYDNPYIFVYANKYTTEVAEQ